MIDDERRATIEAMIDDDPRAEAAHAEDGIAPPPQPAAPQQNGTAEQHYEQQLARAQQERDWLARQLEQNQQQLHHALQSQHQRVLDDDERWIEGERLGIQGVSRYDAEGQANALANVLVHREQREAEQQARAQFAGLLRAYEDAARAEMGKAEYDGAVASVVEHLADGLQKTLGLDPEAARLQANAQALNAAQTLLQSGRDPAKFITDLAKRNGYRGTLSAILNATDEQLASDGAGYDEQVRSGKAVDWRAILKRAQG